MSLYKNKAKFYDKFMEKIGKDYEKEVGTILPYLKEKKSVLELGSGTGNFAKVLLDNYFEVICSDVSLEMLSIAKEKGINCKKIDMRSFSLDKKVDVILSLFNTLMYNKNEIELKKNISSCKNNLNTGGKLIIEVNNPERLLQTDKHVYSVEIEPNVYITQIDLREGVKLFHHFIFIDLSSNELAIDTHETTIFASERIISILKEFFKSVEILDKGNHRYFIATV
ncbi:MAG: class I SAM-dependent methyltransferase [Nanoarchaeota archaeon]|nr:class I SAM-dependent methyltransferase [Nanoarchaeota archaeon]